MYDHEQAVAFGAQYPEYPPALAQAAYAARVIAAHPEMTWFGGGSISTKRTEKDIVGDRCERLYVGGPDIHLSQLAPPGFTALEHAPLQRLHRHDALNSTDIADQLRLHRARADAPPASPVALIHALIPHPCVAHAYPLSCGALGLLSNAQSAIATVFDDNVMFLRHPGTTLLLAKAAAETCSRNPDTKAIVVEQGGLITFGENARDVCVWMLRLAETARASVREQVGDAASPLLEEDAHELPSESETTACRLVGVIRGVCSRAGRPRYAQISSSRTLREMLTSADLNKLTEPNYRAIEDLESPLPRCAVLDSIPDQDDVLKDLVSQSIEPPTQSADATNPVLPQAFAVKQLGVFALGATVRSAHQAAALAEYTLRARHLADHLGSRVRTLSVGKNAPSIATNTTDRAPGLLGGQVALITGCGGAIGYGIADRVLAAGATAAIADLDFQRLENVRSILAERYGERRVEPLVFDVTDYNAVEEAVRRVCLRFGGLDLLVPNAGIAHVAKLESLDSDRFRKVIEVNLMGAFHVIKAATPVFRRQDTGGNIVLVSSKNVPDPGASFGAYSASKAGAHQIGKIAALELAELGVKVNMLNPDAVFGDRQVSSGLWDLIGPDRMKSRGLDPEGLREYYRKRNLLKASVLAEHVGNAVVFFAGNQTPTTGASLPIDGGVPGAFPR